jgi:hypothetical protein
MRRRLLTVCSVSSLLLFAAARQPPMPGRVGQARLRHLGRRLAGRKRAQRTGQRVVDQSLAARAVEEILDLTANRLAVRGAPPTIARHS